MSFHHMGITISHLRNMRSPLKWWVKMPNHTFRFRTRREAIEFIETQASNSTQAIDTLPSK